MFKDVKEIVRKSNVLKNNIGRYKMNCDKNKYFQEKYLNM